MNRYALVVEPDRLRAVEYGRLLASHGLEVVCVVDGQRALEEISRRGPPTVMVNELSLPVLDGFALMRAVRSHGNEDQVGIVAISAFRELRETATRLRDDLGLNGLVSKSAATADVERAIGNAVAGLRDPTGTSEGPNNHVHNEERRLARVARMELVGDEPDVLLEGLVRETAAAFGVPIALVSLVLEDRQWFKAYVGLTGDLLRDRSIPRSWSFCRHVIESGVPMVVPDASLHPAFAENPLVQSGQVRGYAGAPLITPDGEVLGTLCILDSKPIRIDSDEVDALVLLARRVAGELELRAQQKRSHDELAALTTALAHETERSGALMSALSYLQAVLANINAGVMLLDSQRRVLLANEALAEMVGHPREKIIGMTRDAWIELVSTLFDDPSDLRRKLAVLPKGPFSIREEFEIQRPKRAVIRWVDKPVQLPMGTGQLSIYVDITAEHDLARERDRLAYTDALTARPNRRAGDEQLTKEAARALRTQRPLAVVMFDVDLFKQLNDAHGHAAGDDALREIARAMAREARVSDTVARWGGEEFLAILPDCDLVTARDFAERARVAVEQLKLSAGKVTVSAGVAQVALGEKPHAAIGRADERLYAAKSAGRNCVR